MSKWIKKGDQVYPLYSFRVLRRTKGGLFLCQAPNGHLISLPGYMLQTANGRAYIEERRLQGAINQYRHYGRRSRRDRITKFLKRLWT